MTSAKTERETALRQLIAQLSQNISQAICPTIPQEWAQIDLTMPQLKAILVLDTEGPLHMSRLATALSVTMPTATGIVDRLSEKKLVIRAVSPSDRRIVICALSGEGQDLAGRFWEMGRWQMQNLIITLSPEELEVVAEALQILCRAVQTTRDTGIEQSN
jgi:DNA-binding MarR family transcriptional regulator